MKSHDDKDYNWQSFIACQIASENLEKGENGQVGVEIVIEYEDGTTETRFIDLI